MSETHEYTDPEAAWTALRLVREAIEEFGPAADLESPAAVSLRGPEPIHEAEAIVEALIRLRDRHKRLSTFCP